MIELKNISKNLNSFMLENINFSVKEGEYFLLLGASGAGKSVLLEIIAGLTKPDRGKIFLCGIDITRTPIQKRPIGLVFQDYSIFPHLSVYNNIAYSLISHRVCHKAIRALVQETAEKLGIIPLLERNPQTLSGGELQRVALARTLVFKPKCLLLDEPMSSLDTKLKRELRSLLRNINKSGQTIIHVTHHYEEAISLANKIGILESGTVSQIGSPDEIFNNPNSEFIANFCGIANFYEGSLYKIDQKFSRFETNGVSFFLCNDSSETQGNIFIKNEDIMIFNERIQSDSKNIFTGIIIDIERVKQGFEIVLNIGVNITAVVTPSVFQELDLYPDKEVYIYIKESGIQYIHR